MCLMQTGSSMDKRAGRHVMCSDGDTVAGPERCALCVHAPSVMRTLPRSGVLQEWMSNRFRGPHGRGISCVKVAFRDRCSVAVLLL
jgi:hypothetical protein